MILRLTFAFMFNHGQNHKVKHTLSIAHQFGCKDTIFLRDMQAINDITELLWKCKDTIFLRDMQGVMVLSVATAPKYTSRLYVPLLSANRVNRPQY